MKTFINQLNNNKYLKVITIKYVVLLIIDASFSSICITKYFLF